MISPTSSEPDPAIGAPNQTIAVTVPPIIKLEIGNNRVITRFIRIAVPVRSRLARSKRFCSYSSLPNARMTRTPVSFSRIMRVTRSSRSCIEVESGSPFFATSETEKASKGSETQRTRERVGLVPMESTNPPTAKIGARTTTRSSASR